MDLRREGGWGGSGGGEIRPERQLVSQLMVVAEVPGGPVHHQHRLSAAATLLVTLKAGCNERRPSGGQRLGHRGGVLIASAEQLSHFAAHTECSTCFSASIWHISQGGGGRGHRRFGSTRD